jgi:predicted enzyme related to lactoylglutathione lyase
MVELTDKAIRAPMTSIALSPRGPGLWTGCPHYVSAMQWKSDVKVSLTRVILYVQDVERIASFYCDALGLAVTEEIKGEWAVLRAGHCEIALHRVGKAYRVADATHWKAVSNAKLVLTVDSELSQLRAELVAKGVQMQKIKSYPPLTGPLCDGCDPEGNVFQLAQA